MMMKHLLTAIACFFITFANAQSDNCPYNPDSNNDHLIAMADLLAMLNVYGTYAPGQSCPTGFKGSICGQYAYNYAVTNYTPPGCGTIVAKTNNFNNLDYVEIFVTSEGYEFGDIIHLIHCIRGAGETAAYYTSIEDEWVFVTTTNSNPGGEVMKSIFFNGDSWELLIE